jgi:ABC transporter substrate binding protein (PQQ-dependent alcohol dehydrogenase system)
MTARFAAALVALSVSLQGALAAERVVFHYVSVAEDPLYAAHPAYTGLELRVRHRPLDGVRTALRESRIPGRAADLSFELAEIAAEDPADAAERIEAAAGEGAAIFLLDLPAEGVRAAAAGLAGRDDVVLLNLRAAEDDLRTICEPALLHVAPSRAMLGDALAQFLYARSWRRVLMLVGETAEDEAVAAAFRASAEKFDLRIVAERAFALTNDPRQRDRTNLALLTAEPDHDVVMIVDSVGEFGRYVPYATVLPRPVVGSEGLTAEAWHWTFERHGAPQLNQRFDRVAGRRMTSDDWAGWAAVKSVVEAAVRLRSASTRDILATLKDDGFTLDTYKGAPGSFRPWSGQLRQPILLATHNAVIDRAPIDGFLHETNTLDTLGLDRHGSSCR